MGSRKGFELDLIGIMLVALVGLGILIFFVSGTLRDSVEQGFCYLTQKIGINPSWCRPPGIPMEAIPVEYRTVNDMGVNLAAYSIKCWMEASKSEKKKDTVCFELFIKNHPGRLSEEDFTKIMESGGGCEALQNYMVKDDSGNLVEFSGDCGDKDEIDWQIFGNVISDQALIRIEYDTTLNKIVIKG